jgi:RNA polymerase sporulation-specific sigma factor
MLTPAMLLLRSALFLSLHLAGSAGSFPKPLSPEEEQLYLARCIQGDLEARNVLVERNMRLVAHIIKKYYTQTVDQDDLISIGTIGLIKGISSYKPEKNVRLATYAARCIENEILMFFRSQKKLQGEVSLSETLETDKDGNNLFLMDVVGVEDTMLDDLDTRESHIRVRQLVDQCLTEREADIIRQRYGLGGKTPRTQRELAEKYGISRSYVSRIEKRALSKLEEALGRGI